MKINGCGHLYSIDLPSLKLLLNGKEPGYIIPKDLKSRWTLILGSSRQKLPVLCRKLGKVDMFLHDSEHTYDMMLYEYRTVWPYIRRGGLLVSHDVHFNDAFLDFCDEIGLKPPNNQALFRYFKKDVRIL